MWNGVYYRLRVDGDRLAGVLHLIDMDKLATPPDEGVLRPIDQSELEPAEASSHWLPKIVIE